MEYEIKEEWDKISYGKYADLLKEPKGTLSKRKKEELYLACVKKELIQTTSETLLKIQDLKNENSTDLLVTKTSSILPVKENNTTQMQITKTNADIQSLCIFDNTEYIEKMKEYANDISVENEFDDMTILMTRRVKLNIINVINAVTTNQLKVTKENTGFINQCLKIFKSLGTDKKQSSKSSAQRNNLKTIKTTKTATLIEEITEPIKELPS